MRGNQYKKHPIELRFWEKVTRGDESECWEWTGFRKPEGYGVFLLKKGRYATASRFAWELTHGPIPDGLCICHTCDNPPCCNPAHLWLGTRADNNRDKTEKGRNVSANAARTHCKRGHELTPDNITWNFRGPSRAKVRKCRACAREREKRYRIARAGTVMARQDDTPLG